MASSSLKRKTPMKRTGIKRGKRRLPKRLQPTDQAIIAAKVRQSQEFKAEAGSQRVCQECDQVDSWDAHHVVEKKWLKANGKPLYHPANAMRLCNEFSKNDCHGKHTRKSQKVRLRNLSDRNVRYAFAIMGPAAYDYLTRHYRGRDERVERALRDLNG